MLSLFHGAGIAENSELANSMFRDRAAQFCDRLGWDLSVDLKGRERDSYDAPNTLYLVAGEKGRHRGSIRLIPTFGQHTLTNDHFSDLMPNKIVDRQIWEASRFCLSPDAKPIVCNQLLLGALIIGLHVKLSHFVAVFDQKMLRVYRNLGWSPSIVHGDDRPKSEPRVGLWQVSSQQMKITIDQLTQSI